MRWRRAAAVPSHRALKILYQLVPLAGARRAAVTISSRRARLRHCGRDVWAATDATGHKQMDQPCSPHVVMYGCALHSTQKESLPYLSQKGYGQGFG